jgi:hypothetical protein
MRRLLPLLFAAVAAGALAQRPALPKLEPLPEAPPPPPGAASDGPSVRIPVQKEDKVEEMKRGGRVVMLKVTPPGGRPYYLVDVSGTGNWERRESLDSGLRVPMWLIKEFD